MRGCQNELFYGEDGCGKLTILLELQVPSNDNTVYFLTKKEKWTRIGEGALYWACFLYRPLCKAISLNISEMFCIR